MEQGYARLRQQGAIADKDEIEIQRQRRAGAAVGWLARKRAGDFLSKVAKVIAAEPAVSRKARLLCPPFGWLCLNSDLLARFASDTFG